MAKGSTSLKKRDRELKTQLKRMEKASMKRLLKAAAKAAILIGVLSLPTVARAQGVPGGWRLASSGSLTSCYSFTPQVVVPQPSGATINRQVGRIEAVSTAAVRSTLADVHKGRRSGRWAWPPRYQGR